MFKSFMFSMFVLFFLFISSVNAEDFSFTFEWGNIPLCNTGSPNRVPNPIFTLSGVPEGTKKIKFKMVDKMSPYNHGGGTVQYSGQKVIRPGAFKYDSPCPPGSVHTYVWTATALGKGMMGRAKASKKYPEKGK